MPRIKLNFRQLSIPDKINKARQVIRAISNIPAFATPTPSLVTIVEAVDNLESAASETQVARQNAKTRTSAQNQREDVVDKMMIQLAAYVESVAGDNEELIRSAGLDTRAAPSVTGMPEVPAALSATAGDHEGEVDLSWDPVTQARSYVIEQSPDPPTATSWAHAGVAMKSSTTIKNLTSGTRYWWRVAAVGTAGQSGWSDPATRIAP
jgi:hypothetical protein